jgi:adenine-specific DNA-methyltransferase
LIYAGDTGDKWGYLDAVLLAKVGVNVDSHGKMPDVVLFYPKRNWLLLVESVTSHGPADGENAMRSWLGSFLRAWSTSPRSRAGRS